MSEITTLFWDVGGVLLSNGWDHVSRRKAAKKFGLDFDDFEVRHAEVFPPFEMGQISLDEYLKCTLCDRNQPTFLEEFKAFMFAQTQPKSESISFVEHLAKSGKYLMATINNEPWELNSYRINRFHLRDYFSAFFSSCFLGLRKPTREIYRKALGITQRTPEECVFIDDRVLNVESAQTLGLKTIHYQNSTQLHKELLKCGIHLNLEIGVGI